MGGASGRSGTSVDTIYGLRHRLELVATKHGVTYFDDSKGTNVGAVVQSLASFDGPIIYWLGESTRQVTYSPLPGSCADQSEKIDSLWCSPRPYLLCTRKRGGDLVVDTLPEAVRAAATAARTGDTVLLSPACASFDQFRNYAHRGEVFRAAVEAL